MVQFQLFKISLLILVTFLSNCIEIPCVLTGLLESLIFSADIVFRCTMKLDYYPFSDISCRFLFSCSSLIYCKYTAVYSRMGRFFVSKFTMVRVIRFNKYVPQFFMVFYIERHSFTTWRKSIRSWILRFIECHSSN